MTTGTPARGVVGLVRPAVVHPVHRAAEVADPPRAAPGLGQLEGCRPRCRLCCHTSLTVRAASRPELAEAPREVKEMGSSRTTDPRRRPHLRQGPSHDRAAHRPADPAALAARGPRAVRGAQRRPGRDGALPVPPDPRARATPWSSGSRPSSTSTAGGCGRSRWPRPGSSSASPGCRSPGSRRPSRRASRSGWRLAGPLGPRLRHRGRARLGRPRFRPAGARRDRRHGRARQRPVAGRHAQARA